jgi:hypothetical protein
MPRRAGAHNNATRLPPIPNRPIDFGPPVFARDLQALYLLFLGVVIRNDHNGGQMRMQIWQFYRCDVTCHRERNDRRRPAQDEDAGFYSFIS